MKEMNVMDEVLKIGGDGSGGRVEGIEMVVMDEKKGGGLLEWDGNEKRMEEWVLRKGGLVLEWENGKVVGVYKVRG